MAHLVGQRIGSYRLVRQIGWGGFGAVYEGRRLLSNQRWAVKVLQQHHFNAADSRARFLREAQTQSSLNHAHIVPVNDYGFDQNWAYLAMPLIEGGTLHGVLNEVAKQGQWLSLDQIYYYLKQVCAALDYAHTQNIIHLDIKPENLLIRWDGYLLLADFGLAHFMAGEALRTGSTEPAGTPEYMAPERWIGDPVKRSDIYALGIVLFQLLTGRVPFKEVPQNRMKLMQRHIGETPPPLAASRSGLPSGLDQIIHTALAKDPNQRYTSAGALLQAFQAACPGLNEIAVPYAPYGIGRNTSTAPAPGPINRLVAAIGAQIKQVQLPRLHLLRTLRAVNWSSFGLTSQTWFPRVVWQLPPLLFAADLLMLPAAAGIWFHSWWVFAAAFVLPLLALAFAGISGDSKRRVLAVVGALLCALLWGLDGWALGAVFQNNVVSLITAIILGVISARIHIEAFPAQTRYIDAQTERRYWRWWLLCAVDALGVPLLLGALLHSGDTFGFAALSAAAACVLLGIIGDKRNITALWELATILLSLLWAWAGWVVGLALNGADLTLTGIHVPLLALGCALVGAAGGFLVHRSVFFVHPVSWPGQKQLRSGVLLAADLIILPAILGLWFQSWLTVWVSLSSLLALFWLVKKGYQQRTHFPRKQLPTVFGCFLASVIWASAGWVVGLIVPMMRFTLHIAWLLIQGNGLSVLLALIGLFACSPIHLRRFPVVQRFLGSKPNNKTVRIWLTCLLDLFGIPLLFYLASKQQWELGLSLAVAFGLLLLAVIADVWEQPGFKYLMILLSAVFWACNGWVWGEQIPGIDQLSLSVGGHLFYSTWAALVLAGVGFSIGWPLHQSTYSTT
ncbi:MAG TPA: serine/threonine-protein kinase [Ktedonobacterales bacterium]|nr:serine/threonine-protein kinase [Ktedonobacterales bacterium]